MARPALRLRISPPILGLIAWLTVLPSSVVVDAAGGAVSPSSGANRTTSSSAVAVARSWSYVCLCAISEFREGCLADANKLCKDPSNAAIQLSEGSCQEAALGEVGYFLVHEVDVKCKHPYTYTFYESYNLIKALGFTNVDFAKLNTSEIDGKVLFGLTVEQAEHMGLSVGAARHLIEDLKDLFSPHVPLGDTSLKVHQPSAVSVAVVIHEIHEVDEIDFSFKAKFTVYFTWTDISMWVHCDGHNEEIDTGKCSFLWRPKPTWANARQMTIVDRRLQSFPELGKALLELTVDGKFSARMSFHQYPHDYKDLEVEFWLSSLAENRNELLFFPVVATFAESMMGDNEYDALSGWMPTSLNIQEESHTVLELNALAVAEDDAGSQGAFVDLLTELHKGRGNETVDIDTVNMVSKLKFTVRVGRTTRFYMLNYVLIVTTLTGMSWVVFVLPSTQLSNRCTISLTLILALNVFQLIINDSTPKTNYLSPMHEFIISSTFFVVLTALQSVSVHVAARRVALKAMVVRRFAKKTDDADKSMAKGFSMWMSKLTSIRRRHRVQETSGSGDGKAGAGAELDVGRSAAALSGSESKMGRAGDPTVTPSASVSCTVEVEDVTYSGGQPPPVAVNLAMKEKHKNGGGVESAHAAAAQSVSFHEDEDDDGNDAVHWDVKGDSSLPPHPSSTSPRPPLVGIVDSAEAFVATRLDPLSLVIFPVAYFANMIYIFAVEHERK